MADIKERIIEGATKCFVRYGYSKTTLDDIGKSVGLKKNSLYHYFKNKEEIFFVVLEKELEKYHQERQQVVESVQGIRKKIITYMNLRLQACNTQTLLYSILTEMWNDRHPLFERVIALIRAKETAYLESLFTTAHANHEIIDYEYKKLAESLILLSNSIKQHALNRPSHNDGCSPAITYDEHILFIIETLLKAIEAK